MKQLIDLLKTLPEGSENVIENLKLIVKENYSFLKNHKLNKSNYRIIYTGELIKRQFDFKVEIFRINKERKQLYDSGKSDKLPYSNTMLEEFWEYWSEADKYMKFMKCEKEKFWETSKRLAYWFRRSKYSK